MHTFEQFLETSARQINDELTAQPGRQATGELTSFGTRNGSRRSSWVAGATGSRSRRRTGRKVELPRPRSTARDRRRTWNPSELNNFDYPDDVPELDDFDGVHCPMGTHIRRANPRGAQIVQRSANYTRPLVRRGMPYGPPYDPAHPDDGVTAGCSATSCAQAFSRSTKP